MRSFLLLLSLVVTVHASEMPSTFGFINKSYTGTGFTGKTVMVVGGTSGIGFAAAAMFVQECAARVIVLGRNPSKGHLAASVINADASQAHCPGTSSSQPAHYIQASTLQRSELRAAFKSVGAVHAVVNTAGIPGWTNIGLADIPDEAWLGEEDAIHNNLYGTINIMTEALRYWNFTQCFAAIGQPACRAPGYRPSIVNVASVQGLTPSPGMLMYGASKAGIISATNTIAAAYGKSLRANVVAPGLISTPLTWNQVRSYTMQADGTANNTFPQLQFGFQCVQQNGSVLADGDCKSGGTGYKCPCPDIQLEDPRIEAVFKGYPIVDPREVATAILFLASDSKAATKINGETYVVGNSLEGKAWGCPSLAGPPLKPGSCCADSSPQPWQ